MFSASAKQEVIRDIFGWKLHSTYYQGLLDSQSSAEFYEKLGALKPKWDSLEKNKSVLEFHDWVVKYQAEMVNSMIAPVRESAGLGSPPEQYVQNRVESMNRVLKDTPDYQMTWVEVNEMLQKIVEDEYIGFERALYGGDFKLRKEYSKVTVDPQKWHKLSEKRLQAIELAYSSSVTSLVHTKSRSATFKQ